ncbi:MAG: biopolymer transporter ExbD [Chitinophagaceae bacterium]|nr:biopolymer transporter ExbD [Chitinophagaceae bacterium]MBK7678789.1 biopolymer transporter ExbD [Chitinophagaceae bacterium]MBK8299865.1 biopolymer transporter ExbD [Chitinophagaceae bacterium]MBK9463917.1 biopolymer transporter ExbD [Chitinophagaceae bacterium]MBK9658969.1 biopolymer transporter ExbD [Chitinophagaceae bacterium]
MASIDSGGGDSGHKKGPGVKKAKKLSTRVDMTPMVDLGFLLITFFVFTATMTTPTTLDLNMPKDIKDPKDQTEAKESGVLTILLGKGDQVYYYEGKLVVDATGNNFKSTTFKGIRDIIIAKKKDVISRHVHDETCKKTQDRAKGKGDPDWEKACADRDFIVIIKPDNDATYKNTVDILDEMTINQARTYAMVKILKEEVDLINATEATNGIK